VKAKNIEEMYKDFADATSDTFGEYISRSNDVLNLMEKINNEKKGIFKNKWTFVDMFWLIYKNFEKISRINYKTVVIRFNVFEQKRLKYNRVPEELIQDPTDSIYDKDLYNYILSFKFSGSLKGNLKIRHQVFTKKFIGLGIFLEE